MVLVLKFIIQNFKLNKMKKEIYKDHLITFICGKYFALGVMFATLKLAKVKIDTL